MNTKAKKRTSAKRNAVSGRFVDVCESTPAPTNKVIEEFVKGFYQKNGRAMTQLAYE
ncbi:hypothetical protein [Spirosoma sp.]|uniref:hypothetical protein n=1 Tax=Spirosoma sp. TaxID=1899569 RepID=UPI0026396D7A|nr:hypothetical protein [Spirosoma sp.]MCX6216421.1 hypothetical protein [Spirosoma sp.]